MEMKLTEVRDWAKAKIATGVEPPWAWYQYMKLIETVDSILAGNGASIPTGHSQQSEGNPERHLQLVGPGFQPDSVQRHPSAIPAQLPM